MLNNKNMPEVEFTNREINTKFDSIKELLNDIKIQTTKTNGRVTVLEEKNSERKGATDIMKWIMIFLMATVFGYLGWLGNQVSSIHKTLSQYEIEVQ